MTFATPPTPLPLFRRWLARAPAVAWLAAALASSSAAHAQIDDPDAAADAIYAEAKRLFAAGDFMRACPKFNAVHKIDPGVGSALYLGDCLEKQGKLASSQEAFAEAVRLATGKSDKRLEIAEVRLAGVAALVGRLTIEWPPDVPDNAAVDLDERVLAPEELGTPLPLDEGPHVVVFRAPGFLTSKVAKEVKDGSAATLVLPRLLPDPDAAWQISPVQVAGIVIGGVGIAGVIVGGVFGANAIANNDAYQTHCNGQPSNLCRASGTELFDDATREATISTIAFVAGGVLLAGGITLVVAGNQSPTSSSDAASAPLGLAEVAVQFGPGGFSVGGRF